MDIKEVIKSQYHAALQMIEEAVSVCPVHLWDSPAHQNRFWHVAYHAIFFAHLYLQENEQEFTTWGKHRKDYQFLGPVPWPPHYKPDTSKPYDRDEVLEFLALCRKEVDRLLPLTDLGAESGFFWLRFSRLELQFYNIRHIQHHAGQLVERLRAEEGIGSRWVAMKPGGDGNTVRPATLGASERERLERILG